MLSGAEEKRGSGLLQTASSRCCPLRAARRMKQFLSMSKEGLVKNRPSSMTDFERIVHIYYTGFGLAGSNNTHTQNNPEKESSQSNAHRFMQSVVGVCKLPNALRCVLIELPLMAFCGEVQFIEWHQRTIYDFAHISCVYVFIYRSIPNSHFPKTHTSQTQS